MTAVRFRSIVRTFGRLDLWLLYFSTVACIAYLTGLAYYTMFVFRERDTFYFWIAGKVWGMGGSPYSSLFGTVKTALVGTSIADIWLYPPTWYPICRVLAAMPLGVATKTWSMLSLLALFGSVVGWRAYRCVNGPLNQLSFTLLFFVIITAEPTFRSVHNGQMGTFVFLGVNLLLFGALRKNMICAVLGAYLVMLKPSLGIPLCGAAVLMPGMWQPMVIAGAVTTVSMLPAFQVDTVDSMLAGFARNMEIYRGFMFNSPSELTGFFHFADRIWQYQPSVAVTISASIIPIAAAFGCLKLRRASREDTIMSLFVVGISSTAFFSLPHRYDLVCVYGLATVVWHFRPWLVVGLCILPIVLFSTLNPNYLSLAGGITWCAAMATAVLPRKYIIKLSLRGGHAHGARDAGERRPLRA